jgi:DNA-binding MarR family transcriptional regulator
MMSSALVGDDRSGPAVSAVAVGEAFVQSWHTFMREVTLRCGEQGVSPSSLEVLSRTAKKPGIRMGLLAEELGFAGRTVTNLVDLLEQRGFVRRYADPVDRRALRLRLTEQGHQTLAEVRRLRHEACENVFGGLAQQDRRALMTLLTRMVERERSK